MKIENEIHQNKFRNEYQKAIINLIFTYNWLRDQLQTYLAKYHLTMQQYNILRILRGAHQPLSTLQIRERMLDKMSDTSRIVDRLLIKGWVKKTPCKKDRRLVDIVISDSGMKLLQKLDPSFEEIDKIFDSLSLKEAQQINKLLDKVRNRNIKG